MPKITIFLLGQEHHDPATRALIHKEIKRARAAGIKVLVLTEGFYQYSLENYIKFAQENHNLMRDVAELEKLADERLQELQNSPSEALQFRLSGMLPPRKEAAFMDRCHSKELFNDFETVRGWVIMAANKLYPAEFHQKRHFALLYPKKIKFYGELAEAKVPHASIDVDGTAFHQLKSQEEKIQAMDKVENARVSFMAEKAREALAKELGATGGLVFVEDLGLIHAHRLAYHLHKLLKAKPITDASSEAVEVSIVPFYIFAKHTQFSDKKPPDYSGFSKDLVSSQMTDTPEAKDYYKKFPVVAADCFENETKSEFEDQFICPKFTNILEGMVYKKSAYPSSVTERAADSPMLLFNIWKKPEKPVLESVEKEDEHSHKNRGLLVPLVTSYLPR